jgi:hypothetical protein
MLVREQKFPGHTLGKLQSVQNYFLCFLRDHADFSGACA